MPNLTSTEVKTLVCYTGQPQTTCPHFGAWGSSPSALLWLCGSIQVCSQLGHPAAWHSQPQESQLTYPTALTRNLSFVAISWNNQHKPEWPSDFLFWAPSHSVSFRSQPRVQGSSLFGSVSKRPHGFCDIMKQMSSVSENAFSKVPPHWLTHHSEVRGSISSTHRY